MTRQTAVAIDIKTGKEVCATCFGSGVVADPWLQDEDAEYACPECRFQDYQSSDEYFEVSDALELRRERDGLSDERVARAERAQLQERSFTDRASAIDRSERERAAGW